MPLATEKGKQYALEQLKIRREQNSQKPEIDNSKFPAGSPMYYRCLGCGTTITVPEMWIQKPDLCRECEALKILDWLG